MNTLLKLLGAVTMITVIITCVKIIQYINFCEDRQSCKDDRQAAANELDTLEYELEKKTRGDTQ